MPRKDKQTYLALDFLRIQQAIDYFLRNQQHHHNLEAIAHFLDLSMDHFHALFQRWAGVEPQLFFHYCTLEFTKQHLQNCRTKLQERNNSSRCNRGGPGLNHAIYKPIHLNQCTGHSDEFQISYGIHPTPFGRGFIATTKRGICALGFLSPTKETSRIQEYLPRLPNVTFKEQPHETQRFMDRIFPKPNLHRPTTLAPFGTSFQIQVWQALLQLAQGDLISYQDLAKRLGNPKAARAVAQAVAKNPIAYSIPCHRVIRSSGEPHKYRWGALRKRAMIARELSASLADHGSAP